VFSHEELKCHIKSISDDAYLNISYKAIVLQATFEFLEWKEPREMKTNTMQSLGDFSEQEKRSQQEILPYFLLGSDIC
jgi:hypothetical protein